MSRKDEPLFLTSEPIAEGVPALRGMLWEAAVVGNSQGVLPSSLRERFDAALTRYAADCVAAFLASPEAAEGLARAFYGLTQRRFAASVTAPDLPDWRDSSIGPETWEKSVADAAEVLAAWQQERAKRPLRFDAEGTVIPEE